MGAYWTQLFPPRPTLTEQNLPSQKGKVFIVTGGASGVGYQLASILYQAGAKVYIAGRSEAKAKKAIEDIESSWSQNASFVGQLDYLALELDDLTTIKASAESFKVKETKLHVVWNNAGVSSPSVGSKSKQGYELQMATNCLGPFLFTKLLRPELENAAQSAVPNSVRVIWTSSMLVDAQAPQGGVVMADLQSPPADPTKNYAISKAGNFMLASELARRQGDNRIISITQNPGNLKTDIWRHVPKLLTIMLSPVLHDAKMGAYTELWAGLSPDVTGEHNGGYVIPWGRWHPAPRKDLLATLKSIEEGGTGQAAEFWEWCEKQTEEYF